MPNDLMDLASLIDKLHYGGGLTKLEYQRAADLVKTLPEEKDRDCDFCPFWINLEESWKNKQPMKALQGYKGCRWHAAYILKQHEKDIIQNS